MLTFDIRQLLWAVDAVVVCSWNLMQKNRLRSSIVVPLWKMYVFLHR